MTNINIGTPEDDGNTSLSYGDIDLGKRVQELELRKIETQLIKEELDGQIQDRKERKDFAYKIFKLLIAFLTGTLLILSASAIDPLPFKLSDKILITLLATTSADVIGIFLFVVRYLFKANRICPYCGKSRQFHGTNIEVNN
jgi:hypothetical protein